MRCFLVLALLVAGCGSERDAPEDKPRPRKPAAPPAEPQPPPTLSDIGPAIDAASALKRYYGFIEAGDYGAAWAMRSGAGTEAERERFAANFQAYERYRATVGTPSLPARASGWEYVEVPVMIYGSYRGGKPFGSSGSVTLRRAVAVEGASPRERAWHIYTGHR